MKAKKKDKLLTLFVRAFVLVCTAVACYCNVQFMNNLDKNPLASFGIWGMASAVGISFAVIYLINANKETNETSRQTR